MKILKTMIFFTDVPDGTIHQCDTIEHEGHFWLVPQWLEARSEGWRRPTRIIRLDAFQHQDTRGGAVSDFVLNQGIPKAVFDGQIQSLVTAGVVIENPPIKVPIPPVVH